MSASAAFGEQLDSLGVWWPRGDGDAVRDLATGWTQLADLVEDIATVLDAVARSVTENYRGTAADRFIELWQHWTGERGHLATTVADCRRVATAAADFAGDIDLADRTLVRLVEEALAGLTQLTPERLRWLQDCASTVAGDLSARVDVRCHELHQVRPIGDVRAPADIDRTAIDPAAISWPDLGEPLDLAHLTTTVVDFGAGQGVLPSALVPPGPTSPSTLLPTDPLTDVGVLPSGAGITINAPGATINIGMPAADVTVPSLAPMPQSPAEPTPEVLPRPPAAIGGGAGAGGSGSSGGFGGGSGGGISFEPPVVPDFGTDLPALTLPEVTPPLTPLTPLTPIAVDPPSAAAPSPGLFGFGAAGAAAALAAKSAAGGAGGRAPFFPFMPMAGGGSSGDDSPEPKRRSNRKDAGPHTAGQ